MNLLPKLSKEQKSNIALAVLVVVSIALILFERM